MPNFDDQGCHISLGCNCPNSIPAQDDGQITSLKHPTVGIHGKFCHTFFTLVSWTVWSFDSTTRLKSLFLVSFKVKLNFVYWIRPPVGWEIAMVWWHFSFSWATHSAWMIKVLVMGSQDFWCIFPLILINSNLLIPFWK